ncbi:hypothetical protein AB0C02_04550, partial [Micromonospora sp. NPDC048999]|uniref:hypothetical protein n=1 Tax=Micromonospora sp. NPDC048999 TaxID=3155391 RepID=UPI003401CAD0
AKVMSSSQVVSQMAQSRQIVAQLAKVMPSSQVVSQMAQSRQIVAQLAKVMPSSQVMAQLALTAPSNEVLARLAQMSAHFTATMPHLDVDVDRRLAEIAKYLSTVDATGILKEEGEELLEDPEGWLSETEAAAKDGDQEANQALLLVRYLYSCFLLLARRLDPSAKSIERFGPLIAMSVLLTVIVGTLNANNPKMLEKVNDLLSTPIGIVSLYISLRPQPAARARKRKPSMPLRGASRPSSRVLRRRY